MNEKPWLQHYASDVPAEVDVSVYASINELFEASCDRFQNQVALENLGVRLTYRVLNQKAEALAAFFQSELQLQKGDCIALMLPNCLQYVISMLAAFKAGLIVVNINPLYTERELVHQVNDAMPKAIIVLANVANTLAEALPSISIPHIIITELGDAFPTPKALAVNFALKYIKKMLPRYHIASYLKFRQAIKQGKKLSLQKVKLAQDDVAFLQYTGGTTGVAKGAVLTHGNMVANVLQSYAWIKSHFTAKEIGLTPLPLYHIFSLTASCLVYLHAGIHNILVTNPRDIPALVALFKKNKITTLMAVNTLVNALVHHEGFDQIDFSALRLVICGGMALQKPVADRWREVTGMAIVEGYGLTETSPIVTIGSLADHGFTGSIGLPIPNTDIMIANDAGDALGFGEIGELCVKGPQVMQGYWNMPDETANVFFSNGWLRTGDMATLDADGFIRIVDRKKDMISVAGFNVYPNEVEAVLCEHPGVLEAAVVGVPNRITGESVMAYVVLNDPSVDKIALNAYCRQKLTSYKVPRRFKICESLPKSAVGKILRKELRKKS